MSASEPARRKLVPCPTCGTPSEFSPGNPWRPFCSERCRRVDLGAWASERFRVPAASPPDPGAPETGAFDDTGTEGSRSRH